MTEWGAHRIRKLSQGWATGGGSVTTLAGAGYAGFADGTGSAALLNSPEGIAYDSSTDGFLFCDTGNHRVRRLSRSGQVTTLAGSGQATLADGTGTAAAFSQPRFIVAAPGPVFYVSDYGNCGVRQVTASGVVSTIYANCGGLATPTGIVWRASDSKLYVADSSGCAVKSVTLAGAVTTLSSTNCGYVDGALSAARFYGPQGLAWDTFGNLIVADRSNQAIRQVNLDSGAVTTLAGSYGTSTDVDGTRAAAAFTNLMDISYSVQLKCLFVVEHETHRLRRVC